MRRRSFSFSYGRARMATAFLPLAGVRVVDVTSSLAGPYCTEILGALGADVVKVEHPERGDEARAWGPAFWEGSSVMFYAANLNKRSLALDIKRGATYCCDSSTTPTCSCKACGRGPPPGSGSAQTSSGSETLDSCTATSGHSAAQARCVTGRVTTRWCRHSAG